MTTFKQRVLIALVATALAAAAGVFCGYLIGRAFVLQQAQSKLEQDANRVNALMGSQFDEGYSLFPKLNASPYPRCSDAEIVYLRSLVFNSKYIRDMGHMHDGKLGCSALLGRENLPQTRVTPLFSLPDGTQIYMDLLPYRSGEMHVFSQHLGDSYVLYDPVQNERFDAINSDRSVTMTDASGRTGRLLDYQPLVPVGITDRDGQGRVGAVLYATRCDPRNGACQNAYASIPDTLRAARRLLSLFMALGGLSGGLLGFSGTLVHRRNRSMEQQLRRAIRRDQLRLVYQPIVELTSGRIVEAEALARWTDEDGLAVNPEVFVRLAEERGFVGDLTELVVRHALRDFGEILRHHSNFRLNINVTGEDLDNAKFLEMLDRSLRHAGVAASSLAIEVTERSTACKQAARDTIHQLRQRGHSVQIDDFGTGYSSLAYLKDLAIDAIKIDKVFTQAIGTEAVTLGILPQILSMAHSLNLQVIVEGIETIEQAVYFAGSERPVLGQGWFFGRPVCAIDFYPLLASDNERATDPLTTA